MKYKNKEINNAYVKRWLALLALSICALPLFVRGESIENLYIQEREIKELDDKFRGISNLYYKQLIEHKGINHFLANDINELKDRVHFYIERQDTINAISLIIANIGKIKSKIDDSSIPYFTGLLLKFNEFTSANIILQFAKSNGEDKTIAKLNYLFAKYYFERKQIVDSIQYIKSANVYNALPENDVHHALIMYGAYLQYQKKHRLAEQYYRQVPETSSYYPAARLNIAIIYIRQGWWTDAHLIISQLIETKELLKSDDMLNRLYVILGYSMLRNEFYRDARETFRNVSLKSSYANQALLGIALSAGNQGDYVGALNALTILKQKSTYDLYVDETYILLPYIYQKLQQGMMASASYTEAIDYYEQRLNSILKTETSQLTAYQLSDFSHSFSKVSLSNQEFNFSDKYPPSFVGNLKLLKDFKREALDADLLFKINSVEDEYKLALNKMLNVFLEERATYLNSYLSQAQYGLARLYDEQSRN